MPLYSSRADVHLSRKCDRVVSQKITGEDSKKILCGRAVPRHRALFYNFHYDVLALFGPGGMHQGADGGNRLRKMTLVAPFLPGSRLPNTTPISEPMLWDTLHAFLGVCERSATMMKIKEIMTEEPVRISIHDTVMDAIKVMSDKNSNHRGFGTSRLSKRSNSLVSCPSEIFDPLPVDLGSCSTARSAV